MTSPRRFPPPWGTAMKILIAAMFLLVATPALACNFDLDCGIGSKCVKQRGSLDGVCAGGMNPGNDYDRKPYRNPMDMTGRKGNTCSFDLDCGIGGRCVKSGLNGVCM